ncbi:MAG: Lrp/AsnC family transcriptional regulator [Candidatus Poseidoniia archaeon]|jgi:DNA-binding Lrp family transcriptional regulator|nr:Lrp/AsnC family transcriptional regulator [Candidatus Poseidoniia archaeon]MDP6834735.1 Lrp/AsnC family transcriptional regulator [Candidatus Poseidoniia archaeon]MEE3207839.1 Lrp/AsnC family transcriptional regulator [Candidatus Thermoplasmatota archaeon]
MPDKTDRALLEALNRDGRASQRELAAATDVALGTVSNRLRRLHETGIIRGFLPDIDAEQAGFSLTAVMQMRIAKGQIIAVQASVAEHPRVFGVYDVTGEWDSLVLARFHDRAEMDAFIKSTLSQPHIERTNTSLVLNTVKQEPRVVI